MVFLGAVILPHGTMSFDGEGEQSSSQGCRSRFNGLPEPLKEKISTLFAACTKTAETIAELRPDVVVLHTPHGISLSRSVGVYLNNVAKGNALWNEEWSEFQVELSLNKKLAEKFLSEFQTKGIDAEGVNSFACTEAPLRWGEVVPTWYLQNAFKKLGHQPKYVILSQSLKRHGSEVNSERIEIGKCLAQLINKLEEKIVVAISGDLSHTHDHNYNNLPLYLPDSRSDLNKSDKAEMFDRAVEGWVGSCDESLMVSSGPLPKHGGIAQWVGSLNMKWLSFAADLQPEAKSCGIGGVLILHGLLLQYSNSQILNSQFFGRFAPTYYGMMLAVFLP